MNDSCHTYTGATHERFMSLIYRGRSHTHTEIVNLQVSTYTGVTHERFMSHVYRGRAHTHTEIVNLQVSKIRLSHVTYEQDMST